MFRPPVVAIFMEVFFEGIVRRTLQQFGYVSPEIIIGLSWII